MHQQSYSEHEEYTLWAMAYFVNADGSALYIMAK